MSKQDYSKQEHERAMQYMINIQNICNFNSKYLRCRSRYNNFIHYFYLINIDLDNYSIESCFKTYYIKMIL